MEEIKHNKCSTCKCWRLPEQFLNEKGRKLKTCGVCRDRDKKKREKLKCKHNKRKDRCQDCGGNGLCKHNKGKYECRECGSIFFCEHGNQKRRCQDCGGSALCPHKRRKNHCKICDPKGHLVKIVRGRIRIALKGKKSKRTLEYLGCNIQEYKEYIEKQFTEGMTWDNQGEWHIDHIIPINYQKPTIEQIIERLHWTNTQPLWAKDNMSKGNRFIG